MSRCKAAWCRRNLQLSRPSPTLHSCRSGRDPPGGKAKVNVKGSNLEVDIPRGPLFNMERAGTASFALVWNGTTVAWTLSALAAGSILGAAFSLPFWFAGESKLHRSTCCVTSACDLCMKWVTALVLVG